MTLTAYHLLYLFIYLFISTKRQTLRSHRRSVSPALAQSHVLTYEDSVEDAHINSNCYPRDHILRKIKLQSKKVGSYGLCFIDAFYGSCSCPVAGREVSREVASRSLVPQSNYPTYSNTFRRRCYSAAVIYFDCSEANNKKTMCPVILMRLSVH